MLDNESVAVMKPSKYIIRHFLGPSRSPWTISCILRLYQNDRATQTMPRNLIGILGLAIDPTGPCVSIDHGSQTDGINLGQLDSYDGLCIGQN